MAWFGQQQGKEGGPTGANDGWPNSVEGGASFHVNSYVAISHGRSLRTNYGRPDQKEKAAK